MNGLLVVNHYLKGEKFDTLENHLIATAKDMGISLEVKTNVELACEDSPKADFVLFWDKDVNLAKRLENEGLAVFNSSSSIALCDDKAKTYLSLFGRVKQPKTLVAPLRFNNGDLSSFVSDAAKKLGLPVVFKECFGSFGEQVFLCKSEEEIISRISEKPFILQEFITQSAGRDKRLEVVGGKVVCAARRENKNDFRSNVTNGGEMLGVLASKEEKALAVKACEVLGLDFGGVDILDGGYVCEVNSNAHIINIMKSTGVDIAPMIFEHILERIK